MTIRKKKTTTLYNKILGALIGVAVGDALGGPLEFMKAEEIKEKHGRVRDMIGGGWLELRPGEITDDTQMTMCVARGIVKSPADPVPEIGMEFIKWYMSEPKDVGGTCARAIREAIQANAKTETAWHIAAMDTDTALGGKTDGNGALMRTIYPAVFYNDKETREALVARIADMTHRGMDSTNICIEYANAVHAAIFGADVRGFISKGFYTPNADPTGYVVDTWSNVIEAILTTDSFEGAVVNAVNRGGDADTIGAITGGLAGAMYGYLKIPDRWIEALDDEIYDELCNLAGVAHENLTWQIVQVGKK